MANQYVNKVVQSNGTVIMDISDTTATADKILSGYTAYGANGAKLTGTASSGAVDSVNGQTGTVVLDADDVGAYTKAEVDSLIPGAEIFIGSTTPSGYTLYIDPEGMISSAEGVNF